MITKEERKNLYLGKCIQVGGKSKKLLTHQFVKKEGFEKTAVFMMDLFKIISETMKSKDRFSILIEYDTEAINVNIDYLEEAKYVSDGNLLENQ